MATLVKLWNVISLVLILLIVTACRNKEEIDFDNLDILAKIRSLEGVTAVEIEPISGYTRAFQIDILQPVDHTNPDGPKFSQRIYLSHVDEDMPLVFAPHGYRAGPSSVQELALVLQTNCLNVTHRYFYDAMPDPLDWQYLTIKQAADDHHRIVSLFKKIYKGKWISSGASKSGLTALFHRRYYPNDVDATIAYVAPFIFGPKDNRFPQYLSQLGESECFEKLKQVQQYVLKHRTEMLDLLESKIQADNYTYSLDMDLLLELHIMDYPFTFWQYYNYSCTSIPDTTTATSEEIFNHYTAIVPVSSFSDQNIQYFWPFTYQSVTEMGAPAYQTDYLSDLLLKVNPDDPGNPNYELLAPGGPDFSFNYSTITDIYSWLRDYGTKIVYIYGKNDPWSAGAIELAGATDVVFIMQEGENHRVKISSLENPEMVYNALENWLGILIPAGNKQLMEEMDDNPNFRLGF